MEDKCYRVRASRTALRYLYRLFNINHDRVLSRLKSLLSKDPIGVAYDVVDYPGFTFNGRFWTMINNVIILYRISDETKQVIIDAFYHANTERSHEIFWEIDPDDE